jgi:hypothetical protein
VIRQAISCDICATEKKQTNHWFVAYEFGNELRMSGWNSRNRLRPGSKHLCGQTCLHKLVDDFMARAISVRAPAAVQEEAVLEALPEAVSEAAEVMLPSPAAAQVEAHLSRKAATTDASLTTDAAYIEIESSARLITAPEPALPKLPTHRVPTELVAMPNRTQPEGPEGAPDEPPRYASRSWRAEAWDREREREQRATGRRPEVATRRRSAP